jgi:hypothetical protein
MSSPIDLATIPEDQLAQALAKVKSSKATEALRARLPAQLAPLASNIAITEPIHTDSVSAMDGLYYSSFMFKKRSIMMAVTVDLSPYSPSQNSEEPHAKQLELIWKEWETSLKCGTGSADSLMYSLSLRYSHPKDLTDREEDLSIPTYQLRHDRRKPATVKAFTSSYMDVGLSMYQSSHGGIRYVVQELVKDMGFCGGEVDNKLQMEVMEALLGDDGKQLLGSCIEGGTPLREIIDLTNS